MNKEDLKIFQPYSIKSMHMKNRLANAPYGNIPMGDGDGYITDFSLKNSDSLLASGIGMLMCGIVRCVPTLSTLLSSDGKSEAEKKPALSIASLADDSYIPGWKRLVELAHSYGTCIGIQIGEMGTQALNSVSEQLEENNKYSVFQFSGDVTVPKQKIWTKEELDSLCESVAQVGRRAKEAGIDCVEIHCAHSTGLLYANALNPFFNHRDDEYGGTIEKRFHMLRKTVARMRELVGEDYPILVRINGDDLMGPLGNTMEDVARYVVPILEDIGVDGIDISQGGPMYTTEGPLPPMYYPRGCWLHLAENVKKASKLPVIGAGRITTIEMAAKALEDNQCDIIYMGREIFADGKIVEKYRTDGDDRGVRQCIGCLRNFCMPCTVNYKERFTALPGVPACPEGKAAVSKKVLVIGGGVAGMEAAYVCAERGHKVTLWERNASLGGNVAILGSTPLTSEFMNVIEHQEYMLEKTGVDVRVCYPATIERVKEFAPDVVLLATGFDMKMPDYLKGSLMVMDHFTAMKRKREFRSLDQWRKKVVIYGFSAAEFALDLAEQGCDVTLMGPGGDAAIGAENYITRERKVFLKRKLTDINFIRYQESSRRVTNPLVLTHVKLEGADGEGVHYLHNGIHKTMPYDVLIYSGGRKKNNELYEALTEIVPSVIKIGDVDKAGVIGDAIIAANKAAYSI